MNTKAEIKRLRLRIDLLQEQLEAHKDVGAQHLEYRARKELEYAQDQLAALLEGRAAA